MAGQANVLIVGEDDGTVQCVSRMGFHPVLVNRLQGASNTLRDISAVFMLVNLRNGQTNPGVLQELSGSEIPIIVLADPTGPAPTFANKKTKIHVLSRPLSQEHFEAAVQAILPDWTTPHLRRDGRFGHEYLAEYAPLFDLSGKMRRVREIIEQVADTNTTVLIRGATGVGKDLVARAIHFASPRRDQRFVKVNCAALPTELLESELFGHEKGAFTGAYRRKLGQFEFARKGTLFLDEIGELPLGLQAKLLHVLQDEAFSRVGGGEIIRAEARVIASTNRNLEVALGNGQFREDLYYRLNVIEILVPPLRDRRDEIPSLAKYFLEKFRRQYKREVECSRETVDLLMEYSWPGNVRELENIVRRFVVLENVQQLHEEIRARLRPNQTKHSDVVGPAEGALPPPLIDKPMGLREIAHRAAVEAERIAIQEVLQRVHWNRSEAARLLKISYKTLLSKIVECGLAPKTHRSRS